MTTRKAALKRHLITALKVAFVVALLYFLSSKGFISLKDTKRAFTQWQLMVPAIIVLFIDIFLGALRWHWLLRAQRIRITFSRTAQLTFIGNFFNIALPGAVSGDFVKAFYVGREVEGKRARAFGAILFDRVAGLSALVLVSAAAVSMGHEHLERTVIQATKPFILAAAACVVLFYGYLFLVREKHDPFLKILRRLEKSLPGVDSVTRIYEGLRHYHNHRGTVLAVLGISMVVHLTVGWCCLQFAAALGDPGLQLLPVYVVVPLGLLITAIPVAPAGVGTGHAAFLYFFGLIGSQRGADIYTLFALISIFFGMAGGIIYLRFRTHEPKPAEAPA